MVFPSSSYEDFSLFDTAYTLSLGFMKRAFPIIDRDCMRSMWSMECIIAVKGKDAHCEGWVFSSIQLYNYTIMCINCEVFGSVSRRVGS